MKVLLLNPPFVKNFMRNARWAVVGISGSEWYPIWLAYCTGLLEKHGHTVKLLDAQNRNYTHEQTYTIAEEFKPELLVLYFSTSSLKNDMMVGQEIRKRTGAKVILVGPWASIDPKETLLSHKGIDMLARGEFDFTVLDVANRVPLSKIKGLYYKTKNGKSVRENAPRPPVTNEQLEEFPFVTDVYRRHLNIYDYHQTGHQYPYIDLFTGRGCVWGRCSFCIWVHTITKGGGYRMRSVDSVMKELKFIKEKMPEIKEIFLQDDTIPRGRARELAQAILDSGLKITWSCYSRANLDLETMKLMKKAGCRTMHVGFETADPTVLKTLDKGVTVEQGEKFAKDAAKAGLFIVGDFITGLPGETVETIKKTTEWAKKLPIQRYTVTLPKPYKETPLYRQLTKGKNFNKDGEVNYAHLSWEDINKWNRWSLRQIYLSPEYFFRMITKPYEWGRLIRSAMFFFPYLFSRKKQVEYSGVFKGISKPS